ncbi:MAG: cytochrome c-type biogenesis protein [Alphaproteobacteria bacterium]
MRALVLAFLIALGSAPAHAIGADELLDDPVLEARARTISKGLRCLVCQNQSIDESDAPLARDLRRLVRERLVAGESDAAIKAYVVSRYGDFVLLRPPFKATTWALWFGPLVVLLLAGASAAVYLRRQARTTQAATPLSADERRRLDELLDDT